MYCAGRSYTSFQYSELIVTPKVIRAGDNVSVTVSIENTGGINGDEVSVGNIYYSSDRLH